MANRLETLGNSLETSGQTAGLVVGFLIRSLQYGRLENIVPESKSWPKENILANKMIVYLYPKAAGLKHSEFDGKAAFAAMATFYALVSRYDDLLDGHYGPEPLTVKQLEDDLEANKLLGKGIELVKKVTGGEQFLTEFETYRRQEYRLYAEFYNRRGVASFDEVKKHKEETCGLNAELVARLMQLYGGEHLNPEAAGRAEVFVKAALLYTQVYDDIGDYAIDRKTNTANYFRGALLDNPDEEKAVEAYLKATKHPKIQKIRELAPKSIELCDETANKYLDEIPTEIDNLKKALLPSKRFLEKIK